jgi:hypothetical protein
LIGSEYNLFLNPSLCLTYTTTHCYVHHVGRVNFLIVFDEIILLREREKIKKIQEKETKKKEAKKQEDSIEGALCVFLFFCAVVLCDYLHV